MTRRSLPLVEGETLAIFEGGVQQPELLVGTPAWFTWLQGVNGFAYRDRQGAFTARRERRERGGWYWRAYRKQGGRLLRRYLGRAEDLAPERLAEAALALGAPAVDQRHPRQGAGEERATHRLAGLRAAGRTGSTGELLGRAREIAAAGELLAGGARLITLTGTGGTGKTRLALALMEAHSDAPGFTDGCWFVDLTPVRDAVLVPSTIARTLGIHGDMATARSRLPRALQGRCLLLVLDNCEHVLDGVRDAVTAVLYGCPGVTVIAASREPLRLRGEHELPVPPLALPGANTGEREVLESPAVRLYEQQARRVDPDFTLDATSAPAVAEICRRLDGLPLAIELAAAHTKVLPPSALLARLSRRLDLEARSLDVPERHRSLREAVAWSVDRLPAAERAVFGRLAVFAGGWSLEAARAVCGAPPSQDVLAEIGSLLDRSLVRRETAADQEPRFGMLETIREFALEELERSGEAAVVRARHADHFLALCREMEEGLFTTRPAALKVLSVEMDNVRAALRHWIESREAAPALELASLIRVHWVASGQLTEGRRWMTEVLALPGASEPTGAAASVRAALAGVAVRARDANAEALAAEARLVALAARECNALAHAHFMLGLCALERGDRGAGARQMAASRRAGRLAGQPYWEANALAIAGLMHRRAGRPAEAEHALGRALELHRANGHLWGVARVLSFWSALALERGQLEKACSLARQALLADRQLGSVQLDAECFETLAGVLLATGHLEAAARLLGVVASLREVHKTPMAGAEEVVTRAMAVLPERLGEDAFRRAFVAGQALSVPEATAFALAASEPVFARRRGARPPGALTARELQVAGLIARGMTGREIADVLTVSERTVDSHVDHIRNRLGLRSRAEIAAWAAAQGLYRPPER